MSLLSAPENIDQWKMHKLGQKKMKSKKWYVGELSNILSLLHQKTEWDTKITKFLP